MGHLRLDDSDAEIGLARCVLWLLGEVERLQGEG